MTNTPAAHTRPSPRTTILGATLLALALALDIAATARLATSLGVASDLYPRWLGARAWAIEGIDPYSPAIADRVRADMAVGLGWDGRADSGAFAFGFVYPGYVAILLAPLAILPFPVAATAWLLLAQAAIAGTTILLWRTTPGAPTRAAIPEAVAVALAVAWPPATFNLVFGQFATIVTFLLAAGVTLARRGHAIAAGVSLALALVKPQLGLVPAVAGSIVDLHAAWRRPARARRDGATAVATASPGRFALGALATVAILMAGSLAILPGWIPPFLDGVADYARAARATSPAILVGDAITRLATGTWPARDLPGSLEPLPLATGFAVVVAILAGWHRHRYAHPGVPSAVAAGALAAGWVVPPTYEWNHVTGLLVLVPWVRRGGRARAVAWLAASLATFPLVMAWPDGSRATWPVLVLGVWLHGALTVRRTAAETTGPSTTVATAIGASP